MQKLIIAFLLLVSVANAQEEQTPEVINMQKLKNKNEIPNETPFDKRVSVYLHPLALLLAAAPDRDCYLYATVEVPLSSSNSLIIRPSYWDGETLVKSALIFGPTYEGIRLGSDFGFRHYTDEKGKGFYGQGQIGLFHYNERYINRDYINEDYMWFDIMGYIGYVWQSKARGRLFFGIGLGYAIIGGSGYPTGDINLGVGFKIGKNKK